MPHSQISKTFQRNYTKTKMDIEAMPVQTRKIKEYKVVTVSN